MFGENAEKIVEGIWREVYWLDEELPDRALEALKERKWAIHSVDGGARIVAEKSPRYREYIERLEKIADLLKAAAEKLVEGAEREGKGGVKWIKGKPYIAYEGPVELSARVEHVEKDGRKYAVIEAKYGERTARVELDIKKYWHSGLLHNLAAIMTDDVRNFYTGYVLHGTASYFQAAERLLMWAIFMPGEYVLKVRYVHAMEGGLSPEIIIRSRFGWGGLAKIERESPIHRLVLKLARELAGRENLREVKGAASKILAASWLLASAILNTPDGKKSSEGLAVLAERMAEATARRIAWEMAAMEGKRKADDEVMERARRIVEEQGLEEKYKKALERLRPFLEELDKDEKDGGLGTVSREDKAYLVGKMVDYDGYIEGSLLRVGAEEIKEMPIELGGVKINMLDVAEAAAKAFSEEGGWRFWIDDEGKLHIGTLSLGPARKALELKADEEAPLKIAPAFKAMAALIAQETRKGADELRREDLVEYGEPIKYEIGGAEIKITPAKAKEELTPIAQLEEVLRGFKEGKYTHLRLAVGGEAYDLLNVGRDTVKFQIGGKGAQKLKKALEELGLEDVKLTSDGRLYLYREDLEALLSKGIEAYAVRKAKMGEAMWHVEMTYRGVTMELKMTYDERLNRLIKFSRTGKIEAIVYEEGAAEGKRVELDLELLAAIREGQLAVIEERCKNRDNCPEKQLAEILNAASKDSDFNWSVTGGDIMALIIKPPNLKDTVRRFYSE